MIRRCIRLKREVEEGSDRLALEYVDEKTDEEPDNEHRQDAVVEDLPIFRGETCQATVEKRH